MKNHSSPPSLLIEYQKCFTDLLNISSDQCIESFKFCNHKERLNYYQRFQLNIWLRFFDVNLPLTHQVWGRENLHRKLILPYLNEFAFHKKECWSPDLLLSDFFLLRLAKKHLIEKNKFFILNFIKVDLIHKISSLSERLEENDLLFHPDFYSTTFFLQPHTIVFRLPFQLEEGKLSLIEKKCFYVVFRNKRHFSETVELTLIQFNFLKYFRKGCSFSKAMSLIEKNHLIENKKDLESWFDFCYQSGYFCSG